MPKEQFNYCIARYWNGVDGSLCVYTYGNEIHYGDQEDAESLLEYVNRQNENDYKIIKVGEAYHNRQHNMARQKVRCSKRHGRFSSMR
jgi:hypothetical protein